MYRNLLTGEVFTRSQMKDMFAEMLNGVYGNITVVDGLEFTTAYVFEALKPSLYMEHFHKWLNAEIEQGVYREEK